MSESVSKLSNGSGRDSEVWGMGTVPAYGLAYGSPSADFCAGRVAYRIVLMSSEADSLYNS